MAHMGKDHQQHYPLSGITYKNIHIQRFRFSNLYFQCEYFVDIVEISQPNPGPEGPFPTVDSCAKVRVISSWIYGNHVGVWITKPPTTVIQALLPTERST